MKISEVVSTMFCIAILFILVAVLFVVKDNMNGKNKVNKEESDPNKVVITYNINGGNDIISSSTIEKGSTLTLPTPTREGYKFVGWYVDGKLVDEYTRFDKNTTIVAKWILIGSPYENNDPTPTPTPTSGTTTIITKPDFRVTFDSKGGSAVAPITVKCNNTPLDLPTDPSKDGYDFNGWVTKSGKKIANGSIISCEDITLYATWKVADTTPSNPDEGKKYIVSFDTGAGIAIDPVVLECGKVLLDLRDLGTIEIDDYKKQYFDGWYDESGKKVTNGSTLQCKDQTLTAHWYYSITQRPIP